MIDIGILYRWDPSNYLLFTHTFYPIIKWYKPLRGMGLRVFFHTTVSPRLLESDVILVADYFPVQDSLGDRELDTIAGLRERGAKVVFLDNRDSCGTTSFEVLPYVDRYCKKQLYKDRGHYCRPVYGLRTYAEFYHERFGVNDTVIEHRVPLTPEHAGKLCLSWNLGLGTYELHSGIIRRLNYFIYKYRFPCKFCFDRDLFPFLLGGRSKPLSSRTIDFHCRGRREYGLATIAFGRKKVDELLDPLAAKYVIRSKGSVSRKRFRRELADSKIVISPFGYGEVCHRDFEAMSAGCLLVKPSMDQLETWPNYYRAEETYIPYSWDFSDVTQRLEEAVADNRSRRIAQNAHELHTATVSESGRGPFCRRFADLCTF